MQLNETRRKIPKRLKFCLQTKATKVTIHCPCSRLESFCYFWILYRWNRHFCILHCLWLFTRWDLKFCIRGIPWLCQNIAFQKCFLLRNASRRLFIMSSTFCSPSFWSRVWFCCSAFFGFCLRSSWPSSNASTISCMHFSASTRLYKYFLLKFVRFFSMFTWFPFTPMP